MSKKKYRRLVVCAQIGTVATLLGVIEVLARGGVVSRFALAPSSEIIGGLFELTKNGIVVVPLIETLLQILITFLAVAMVGPIMGFCFWRWNTVRNAFEPLMLGFYAVPVVIFYPILLVVLGIGPASIMGLAFLLGITPVVLGVWNALKNVDPDLLRVADILGASEIAKYVKVLFPAALPAVGGTLRLGFSYVVIGIIAGQFLISTGGLGKLVANYYDTFQVALMYSAAAFVILLASIINIFLERL